MPLDDLSRNPLLDLGFPPEEAARALKLPQPTISKIVNGNVEKLSIEFLVKLAVRASLSVSISVGRAARTTAHSTRERVAA